jgi:ParB/RepB/Spo0J family partition protein
MENITPVVGPAQATFQAIPVESIRPSSHQFRKDFNPEELQCLADSMKEEGLIQPIIVRQVNGSFELVAGERRYRAAKLLQWPTIEAKVVVTVSEAEAAAKGVVENLQRKDLNPIEEAEGFQTLNQLDPNYWTHEKIAQVAGRSRVYITQSLGLLKLAPEVLDEVTHVTLSRSHAIQIMRLGLDRQAEAATKAKDLSWKETCTLVDQMLGKETNEGGKGKGEGSNGKESPLPPHPSPFTLKKSGPDILGTFRMPLSGNLDDEMAKLKEAILQWLQAPKARDRESAIGIGVSPDTDDRSTIPDNPKPRLPQTPEEEKELEEIAVKQGPRAVYAWTFGSESPMVAAMPETWDELGISDPVEALRQILSGMRMLQGSAG